MQNDNSKQESRVDEIQDNITDNTEPEDEKFAEKAIEELAVNLPGENLPMMVRVIAFFTLIGGLSIIGSLFADIVRPQSEDLSTYILRIIVAVVAVVIAYGIIEHERWAIWLYGIVTLVSLFTNPFLSFIPGVVVVYLYTQRSIFTPSLPDSILARGTENIINFIRRNKAPESEDAEKY